MKKEEYLRLVRKEVFYIFDRNRIEEELKEHLEDSIEELMEEGLSYEEAEIQAVAQMGSPSETGKLLNREHKPMLGYLYLASNIIAGVFLCYFLLSIAGYMRGNAQMLTPVTTYDCKQIIALNMELNMPTHRLTIDNICIENDGSTYLTYRTRRNYWYSRAGWNTNLFLIKDSYGNELYRGAEASGGYFGVAGVQQFEWPEDNLLYLECIDGQEVRIDLEGYNEEK